MSQAIFHTDRGDFTVEFFASDAPQTVENFTKLIGEGFFDGIAFHRIIPEFVVQGGDPNTKELPLNHPKIGTGGPGYQIPCETRGNPRRHEVGALSMAHAGKDTGGSQFFIVLNEQNTRHLDGVHTVFGKVSEGMDVVRKLERGDRIQKVETTDSDAG